MPLNPDTFATPLTQRLRDSALCCFTLSLLFGAAGVGLSKVAPVPGVLWLANGILVCWLYYAPWRRWPLLVAAAAAGQFLGNLSWGDNWQLSAALLAPNMLEPMCAVLILRHTLGWRTFDRNPLATLQLAAYGFLLPSTLGATLGALIYSGVLGVPAMRLWPGWFAGDVVGLAAVVPLGLLLLRSDTAQALRRMLSRRALLMVAVVVVVDIPVQMYLPTPFIYTLIPLTLAAIWLPLEAACLVIFVGAVVTSVMITLGHHALAPVFSNWNSVLLFLPVFLSIVASLVLAASVGQSRDREQARVRSEKRFRDAIQFAATGLVLGTRDGRIQEANDAFCRMLGYTRDEIIGRSNRDLTHPDDMPASIDALRGLLAGEYDYYHLEKRYLHKDGHPIWAEIKVSRLEQADEETLIVQIDNIEERRAQQQQILGLSERLTLATRAVEMGVWDWNVQTSEVIWDDQMYRLYFLEPGAQPATYALWRRAVHPADIERVEGRLDRVINEGVPYAMQYRIIGPSGQIRHIDAVGTVLRDEQGQPQRVVGVNRDITGQLQAQEKLEQARDAAEELSLAKSAFVANMSHEIRTPMNAVLGMAQLLAETPLNADQRKYVDMIRSAGRSLLAIINDILDFSRLEAGRMDIAADPFSLDHLLASLSGILSVNAGHKPVEVAIGQSASVPRALIGDELRLQQILTNLCSNALKFTERGEVSLRVNLQRQEGDQVWLHFAVRDTGIGMTSAQQQRLFDAFSQGDISVTRRFGGSGLGLAIARRLAQAMQGDIQVSSTPGRGSCFELRVPLRLQAGQPQDRDETPPQVLLAIGNATARNCLADNVTVLGWPTITVGNGNELLLRSLASSGPAVDLIVVDAQLAGLDGAAFVRGLRQDPRFAHTLLLVLASFFEQDALADHDLLRQADGVLVKPVTAAALHKAVQDARLKRSGLRTETEAAIEPGQRVQLQGRVLLVEDNAFNQILAELQLRQLGLEVDIAADGAAAVSQLRQQPQRWQLVLMDVQMPVMDGMSATRVIRSELQLSLPVIAMSAGVLDSERVQCLQAGMDGFVGKPVDRDQLTALLCQFLPGASVAPAAEPVAGPPALDTHNPQPQVLRLSQILDQPLPNPGAAILLRGMVNAILERGMQPLQQIRQAADQRQVDEVIHQLHSLRGAMGNVGAERLAQALLHAETHVRDSGLAHMPGDLQRLEQELQAVLQALRDWLQRQEEHPAPDEQLGPQALPEWRELLQARNMAAFTRYQALRQTLLEQVGADDAARIQSAMYRLDFAEVLHILDSTPVSEGNDD